MSFQTVTMTLLDGFLLNIELFAVTLVLSLPWTGGVLRHHEPLQAPEPSGAPVCLHHALHPTDAPTGGGVLSAASSLGLATPWGGWGRPSWPLCSTTRPTSPRSSAAASRVSPPASGSRAGVGHDPQPDLLSGHPAPGGSSGIVPPMGNEFITLVKDTSLSNFIMVGRSSSWPRTSATRA